MPHTQRLSVPGTISGARRRRPVRIIAPIVNTYSPITDHGQHGHDHAHGVESVSDRETEQQAS